MRLHLVPNDPPPPADEAAAEPVRFEDLIAGVEAKPYKVAARWSNLSASQGWDEAAAGLEAPMGPAQPWTDDPAKVRHRMRSLMDAIVPQPLLIVLDGKVQVVHAFRRCPALGEYRAFGLLGERDVTPGGTLLPPQLYRPKGAIAEQHWAFARVDVATSSVPAAETLLEEDPDLTLVPVPEPPEEDQPALPTTSAWKALPIPPKLAILFVRGLPVKEAFGMMLKVYRATPADVQDKLEELLAFGLCAVTQETTPEGEAQSALESGWVREDPAGQANLEGWYHDLLDAYLPPPAPITPSRSPPNGEARMVTPPTEEGSPPRASPSAPARKMPYTRVQIADLATFCGIPLSSELVEVDDLPEFWRAFEEARAKKTTARQALEEHRRLNYPEGKLDRVTIFTPQFVADLQTLSFDGNDGHFAWGEREKGFSPFALPPLPDDADVAPMRDKYTAYESTEDRHRPSDRLELSRLGSGDLAGLPESREEFYQWADHLETMSELFFTTRSPLVWFFREAKRHLLMPRYYRNFQANDWRAYLWPVHTAMREFFGRGHHTTSMQLVLAQFARGVILNPREVPSNLLRSQSDSRSGGTGGGAGGGNRYDQGRDTPAQEGSKAKRQKTATTWEPAKRWAADKAKAKKAVEAAGGRYTFAKMFPEAHKASFWPAEFLSCVEGKPPRPCPYHFILGSCTSREPCRSHHKLTKEPSAAAMDELTSRIRTRCEEVTKNPELLKD